MKIKRQIKLNWLKDLKPFNKIIPKEKLPILPWIDANIVKLDNNDRAYKYNGLHQYQKEIIQDSELPYLTSQVILAVPRVGKTTCARLILAYRCANRPAPALAIYPSDKECEATLEDQIKPLFKSIADLAPAMARHNAVRADRIQLDNNTIYLQGAQKACVNKTVSFLWADELDFWGAYGDNNVNNLRNAKIRALTYPPGERLVLICSSPNATDATFGEWEQGSRGRWHNACIKCGQLHKASQLAWPMENGTFTGLQWERDDNNKIIRDSIVFICNRCGHKHTQNDSLALTSNGKFVHEDELNPIRSYQIASMACPVYDWFDIAVATENKNTSLDARKHYYYNILGLQCKNKKLDIDNTDNYFSKQIKKHFIDIKEVADKTVGIFASLDVQSEVIQDEAHNYYVYCVRGIDNDGKTYLLDNGKFKNDELEEFLNRKYLNLPIAQCIIDQGGFAHTEKDKIILKSNNSFYYKGTNTHGEIKTGKATYVYNKDLKLVLASPTYYQSQLLYNIYNTDNVNNWFITKYDNDYILQVSNIRPKKSDDNFERWAVHNSDNRKDYADCEKMLCCLFDCLYNRNFPVFTNQNVYKDGKVPNVFVEKFRKWQKEKIKGK